MNGRAGTFNPSLYSSLQQSKHNPNGVTKARRDSLEPASDSTAAELKQLKKDFEDLKDGTLRELSLLRHDVDLLLRGGWTVKVGPFQTILEPSNKRLQHSTASSDADQIKLTANEIANSESKSPEREIIESSKVQEAGVTGAVVTSKP